MVATVYENAIKVAKSPYSLNSWLDVVIRGLLLALGLQLLLCNCQLERVTNFLNQMSNRIKIIMNIYKKSSSVDFSKKSYLKINKTKL